MKKVSGLWTWRTEANGESCSEKSNYKIDFLLSQGDKTEDEGEGEKD